jgi:N-acetylneuraminate synthase
MPPGSGRVAGPLRRAGGLSDGGSFSFYPAKNLGAAGDGGADGAFSMEPAEFSMLVKEGTSAALALGNPGWSMQDSEKESRRLRRSLYIVKDVQTGEVVTHDNVRAIRPGGGCAPSLLDQMLGGKFSQSHTAGTPMAPGLVIK